jgi:DNA helicase-2/ATP-dependent DNA helicase PcrA
MSASTADIPHLEGDALGAVEHRGGHLQIVASAGAGKTEVVAQRVAGLLAEGVDPSAIVAFTFTEKAAASLKTRIDRRAVALVGPEVLDRIGTMFVGTIHSYCLRLLQVHVPRFEVYDVLDDHRLTAFLTREGYRLGIADLGVGLYSAIASFASSVQVIENELIDERRLPEPFRGTYRRYCEALHASRLLTYGQFIAHAVGALQEDERVRYAVQSTLRHLIVDEYQDINPAQEALVAAMVGGEAHLCVVGDDQQCIFQWRGSTVSNIRTFHERYDNVATFRVEANRRSRPQIVRLAERLSESLADRLAMGMHPTRPSADTPEVSCWQASTRSDEAQLIAAAVRHAHDRLGYRYRDIAILCRLKSSLPAILDALAAADIPVQPGGRTALFDQPEAELFGRMICWLLDYGWRVSRYGWQTEPIDGGALFDEFRALYGLVPQATATLQERLQRWKTEVDEERRPANLVRDYYEVLALLGVEQWDLDDPLVVNRMGTLARCSQLLADYEAASRRSRPSPEAPGEQRGARDRGRKYYEWLARYVQNWARGAYESFEGEEDVDLDAVEVLTMDKAKGLEWPVVFVPALTVGRFPSRMIGQPREWLIPRKLFDASRYEGTDDDERRLFYVALTRARDFLSLSTFRRIKNSYPPSPYPDGGDRRGFAS